MIREKGIPYTLGSREITVSATVAAVSPIPSVPSKTANRFGSAAARRR